MASPEDTRGTEERPEPGLSGLCDYSSRAVPLGWGPCVARALGVLNGQDCRTLGFCGGREDPGCLFSYICIF